MKVETNQGTIRELQGILDAHDDAPRNIRFYKESSCCGGDAFGIVVDDVFEDDVVDNYHDLNFVMDAELYEETGDMIIEYLGNGFFVEPVKKKDSKCGGCHEKEGAHEHGSGGCSGCQH